MIADLSQLNFADADDRRAFPPTLHSILARHGLFGLTTPGEHGGLALPLQEAIDLISATASFDVSAASTLVVHNFLALPCIEAAPHIPEQNNIIWGATRGDLCAFALTEPGAGSAPRRLRLSCAKIKFISLAARSGSGSLTGLAGSFALRARLVLMRKVGSLVYSLTGRLQA
ncbi:acyl-CoA/acyl-ACP dehydrogenase [Bradyrhizobium sp. NBAIM08]|nr:acyl-CoA/acyl-ACP dehydrogenase [Bradyrhizobium sp. NBAIM08]